MTSEISIERAERIAGLLPGVTIEDIERTVNYDWPNAAEHKAWLVAASDKEIASWIAAVLVGEDEE